MSSERNLAADDRVVFDADGFIVGLKPSANRENRMAAFTLDAATGLYSLATPDGVSVPLGGVSLAGPVIIAKTNQRWERMSGNAGGDNTRQPVFSFLLPAGSMGRGGDLVFEYEVSHNNSAAVKLFGLRIGLVHICPEFPATTTTNSNIRAEWGNTSVSTQKFRGSLTKQGSNTTGFVTTAIDTGVNQTVEFYVRWGASSVLGETIALEKLRAWVEYGA